MALSEISTSPLDTCLTMRAATGWNVHRTNTTVAWPSQFELLSALWVIPRERTLGQESGTVPSAKASRVLAAAQANCSRFFVSEETFAGLLLVCSRWGRSRWLTQWDRRALHFQNIQSPDSEPRTQERGQQVKNHLARTPASAGNQSGPRRARPCAPSVRQGKKGDHKGPSTTKQT